MSGIEIHRVDRAITGIAFEVADRVAERTLERAHIGLAEYTEEWHVAASGFVSSTQMVSASATIEFSMDFFEAPEQRRSDLTMPTFHFGSYQASGTNFVCATAAVREYIRRSDDAVTGAIVAFGVFNPNGLLETTYDVLFHLSFSGWGAPYDVETGEADT